EMSMNNGVMKMRPVKGGLEIKPGETVELKPQGLHIMFVGLKKPLAQGDHVKATLVFEKAGKVDVEFDVSGMGGPAGHTMPGMKLGGRASGGARWPAVDELIIASRAVHLVALALLLGPPFFRLAISPDGPARAWPGRHAIELTAGAVALVSALGWFAGVAAGMTGSWADAFAPGMLPAVALDTRFGRLWIARLAAMAAILAVYGFASPTRARDVVLVFLASAVTASLVGTGHGTAGEGAVAPIHAVADVTHLLCALGWIGGLFCLAQLLRRAPRGVRADVPRLPLP